MLVYSQTPWTGEMQQFEKKNDKQLRRVAYQFQCFINEMQPHFLSFFFEVQPIFCLNHEHFTTFTLRIVFTTVTTYNTFFFSFLQHINLEYCFLGLLTLLRLLTTHSIYNANPIYNSVVRPLTILTLLRFFFCQLLV